MTAACAMRDHWLAQLPEDGDEGSSIVGYGGTLITVYWTAYSDGLQIDGIEHAGLTLDADDMSESMRASLVASVRAQFDGESA